MYLFHVDLYFVAFFVILFSALSKAKLFLPQLQKANQDLEAIVSSGRRDAVDIEKIDEDEQFIEMVNFCFFHLVSRNEVYKTFCFRSGCNTHPTTPVSQVSHHPLKATLLWLMN